MTGEERSGRRPRSKENFASPNHSENDAGPGRRGTDQEAGVGNRGREGTVQARCMEAGTSARLSDGEGNRGTRKNKGSGHQSYPVSLKEGELQQALPYDLDLEHLSVELRGKSKEPLCANMHQTKRFFRKLKRYIDFLSTPSESVSECRMKQQIAVKISKLLASEEGRLTGGDGSDQSRPESSARPDSQSSVSVGGQTLPTVPSGPNAETSAYPSPGHWKVDKTRSEERYERCERKKVNSSKEVEFLDDINKKRVEHIRNLKKELKILERLENQISFPDSSSTSTWTKSKPAESPTRKLSSNRKALHTNDTTTVTDNLLISRDVTNPDRQGEDKGIQVGRIDSDLSSTLSLISETNHR